MNLAGAGLLLLLVANAAGATWNINRLASDQGWILHTQRVLIVLEQLLEALDDAENGAHGYALTGDSAFLQRYQQTLPAIDRLTAQLQAETADNAVQQGRLPALRQLIAHRVALLHDLVAAGRVDALSPASLGEGRQTMEAIRALLAEMRQVEEDLLVARNARAATSLAQTRLALLLASGAAMLLLGWVLWLVGRIAREQEAVRASEAPFRQIFDQSAVGIVQGSLDHRILDANPGYCRIIGYPIDELRGRPLIDLTHPDDRAADAEVLKAFGSGALAHHEREKRYLRKDGSVVWVLLNVSAVGEPGGPPGFLVGIAQDITGRKAAEEEVRRLSADLEHRVAERTAQLEAANQELEAFSYSVSHDLRAPLRAMQGFAQALQEDFADDLDPLAQEYAERIVAAASRMDQLIQDLLAYSRLGRSDLPLRAVSLADAVADACAALEADLAERSAEVEVATELPLVWAHGRTLVQVLANLLSNAVKFTPAGTRPCVRVWAERRDGRVRLWVEDNGIGVASEHQERIFRVFERLHGIEAYPGTGIGLAIVSKGVERMGGRVGVESHMGQGSRFWIELGAPEEDDAGSC